MHDSTKVALKQAARQARSEYVEQQERVAALQSNLARAMQNLHDLGVRYSEIAGDAAEEGIDLNEPSETDGGFAHGTISGMKPGPGYSTGQNINAPTR